MAETSASAGRPAAGRRRLVLVTSGLLFATVLAGNVSVYATTNQGQFELERLQRGTSTREAGYQQLRLQVAQLQSPGRVMERARQLGMIEPAKVTYLTPTASTSAEGPSPRATVADPPAEAAQSWGQVKPQLDRRR